MKQTNEDEKSLAEIWDHQSLMGLLILVLIVGLVTTTILVFFGGSPLFPWLNLIGLAGVSAYYYRQVVAEKNET